MVLLGWDVSLRDAIILPKLVFLKSLMVIWCKNVMPCLEYKKFSLLRKEKRQLSYFLISKCNISKAIHEYVQEIVDTIWRHMEHMYINITLIPKMLELMSNGTTNAKLLENYFLATLF